MVTTEFIRRQNEPRKDASVGGAQTPRRFPNRSLWSQNRSEQAVNTIPVRTQVSMESQEAQRKRVLSVIKEEHPESVTERITAIDDRRSSFEDLLNRATVSARRHAIKAARENGTKPQTKRTLKAQLRASLMRPNQDFDVTTLSKAGQKAYEKAKDLAATVKREQREKRTLRWKEYLINQDGIETKADELMLKLHKEGANPHVMRSLRSLYPNPRMVTKDGYRDLFQSKNPRIREYLDLAAYGIDRHERNLINQIEIRDKNAAKEAEIARIRADLAARRVTESARLRQQLFTNYEAPQNAVSSMGTVEQQIEGRINIYRNRVISEYSKPPSKRVGEVIQRLKGEIHGILAKVLLPTAIFWNRKRAESARPTPVTIFTAKTA